MLEITPISNKTQHNSFKNMFWSRSGHLMVETQSIDNTTQASVFVTHTTNQINEGNTYKVDYLQESVANNIKVMIGIETSGRKVHFKRFVNSEGKAIATFYEGASFTLGANLNTFNLDRTSTTTSNVLIKTGISASASGTLLTRNVIFGSSLGQAEIFGTPIERDYKFILKTGTKYLFEVQNVAGSSKDIECDMVWHET